MFKQFFQITLLALLPLSHVVAKGWVITCPLTATTDDHLYRDFVQNCGARVEDINPKIFEIVFASIKDIDPVDNVVMTQTVQKWKADNQAAFKGLSLDLSNIHLDKDEIFATTTFLKNQLYCLRDRLQKHIHSVSYPSGRKYVLDTNDYGYHLFSILVGDIKGIDSSRAARALQTLQDRVEQARVVYPDTYMELQLEQPVIKISN